MGIQKIGRIIVIIVALFLSIQFMSLIVTGRIMEALAILGFLLLVTIYRWAEIGVFGLLLFFFSAFQLPLPGNPQLWQLLSLLIPVGILIGLLSNKYNMNELSLMPYSKVAQAGSIFYAIALLLSVAVHNRGAGSLVTNVGGRLYLESLAILFLPIAIALLKIEPKKATKIILSAFALSFTYVISEMVIMFSPGLYPYFGMFIGLSADALDFAASASQGGYVRLQAVAEFSLYLGYIILALIPLYKKPAGKRLMIYLLVLVIFSIVSVGGARKLMIYPPLAILLTIYMQRVIGFLEVFIGIVAIATVYAIIFIWGDMLPAGVQRAVSIVPGAEKVLDENLFYDAIVYESARENVRDFSKSIDYDPLWGRGLFYDKVSPGPTVIDALSNSVAGRRYGLGLESILIDFGWIAGFFVVLSLFIFTVYVLKIVLWARKWYPDKIQTRIIASCVAILLGRVVLFINRGDIVIAVLLFVPPISIIFLMVKALVVTNNIEIQKAQLSEKSTGLLS